MSAEIETRKPTPIQKQVLRVGTEKLVSPFFNTEILHRERIVEIDDYLKRGNGGLLVDATHLLKRDTAEIYRLASMSSEIRKRHIFILVALHQERSWFGTAHAAIDSELGYVLTPDSKEKFSQTGRQFDRRMEADLLVSTMNKAVSALEAGNVVFLFGQGGRRPHLYEPNPQPTEFTLYNQAKKSANKNNPDKKNPKEPQFGITQIGFDIAELPNYEEAYQILREKDKLDRKLPYVMDIGHTYPVAEYVQRAGNLTQKNFQEAINNEREKLVTPRYIGLGPLQLDSDFPERTEKHKFDIQTVKVED